jgi:hypothetical protein
MKWYRRSALAVLLGALCVAPTTLVARQDQPKGPVGTDADGRKADEGRKALYLKVVQPKVEVKPGEEFVVELDTNAKLVRFWSPDGLKEYTFWQKLFPKAERAANVIPFRAPNKDATFRIFVYGSNSTNLTEGTDENVVTVVVGKGGPVPPGPVPDPVVPVPDPVVPPPDPPKPGKAVRFVVVEDTSKAEQFRGQVMSSPKLVAFYKANNLKHRIISTKAEGPDGARNAEVEAFLKLAEGKELPWLFTQAADGSIQLSQKAATDPDSFIKQLGGDATPRAMGNLEPPANRARKFKMFGAHPNVPIIRRENWRETDLSAFLPPVEDQDGQGACNAFSSGTCVEAARAQAGLPYVELSRGFIYGNINGGRDQGSYLEDALEFLTDVGTCEARLVGHLEWRKGRTKPADAVADAKNYRIIEAYECPSFEAIASAIQQGFFINEGLDWPSNDNVDREGWLPMNRGRGVGGHALCGYGLKKHSNGTWGIMTRNSWGTAWGIGGNCIIPESYFTRAVGGYWAVRAVTQTPTEWPVPKTTKVLNPFEKHLALAW